MAAPTNEAIGGLDIMEPNGQAQYTAPDLFGAYQLLLRHYDYTHVAPGQPLARRVATADPLERDVTAAKNKKDFDELHGSFISLPRIPIDQKVIEIASRWGFEMDRKGKIVSSTDLIIASTAYKNARLLHLDADFKAIASFYDLEEEMISC